MPVSRRSTKALGDEVAFLLDRMQPDFLHLPTKQCFIPVGLPDASAICTLRKISNLEWQGTREPPQTHRLLFSVRSSGAFNS